MAKELWIVGGPNGAGKTTWVSGALKVQQDVPYLSADRIAAGLSPGRPEEAAMAAGREFLRRLRASIEAGEDLIVESTLSGRGMIRFLELARERSYRIVIVFIFLRSADLCVRRVRARVQKGGHNVPEPDILRRYGRSKVNFWNLYRPMADAWHLFYNGARGAFQEVAMGGPDAEAILNVELFELFLESGITSDEA